MLPETVDIMTAKVHIMLLKDKLEADNVQNCGNICNAIR